MNTSFNVKIDKSGWEWTKKAGPRYIVNYSIENTTNEMNLDNVTVSLVKGGEEIQTEIHDFLDDGGGTFSLSDQDVKPTNMLRLKCTRGEETITTTPIMVDRIPEDPNKKKDNPPFRRWFELHILSWCQLWEEGVAFDTGEAEL